MNKLRLMWCRCFSGATTPEHKDRHRYLPVVCKLLCKFCRPSQPHIGFMRGSAGTYPMGREKDQGPAVGRGWEPGRKAEQFYRPLEPAEADGAGLVSGLFLRMTTRLLATGRSLPSQGLLTTRPRYQNVAEPPPSRLMAVSHPSLAMYSPSSSKVMPRDTPLCRPSTSPRK